jgi:hypothetical protein
LPSTPFRSKPGPRGLAPSSGPLRSRPLPDAPTRCSLGLVQSVLLRASTAATPLHARAESAAIRSREQTSVTSKTTPRSGSSV